MADNGKGGMVVSIGVGKIKPGAAGLKGLGGSMDDRQRHAADVEADFLGKPQPYGTFDPDNDGDGTSRVSADAAGYMELDGARKDADCNTVDVPGGVSSKLGCCNLFDPQQGAQMFRCGTCERMQQGGGDATAAQGGISGGSYDQGTQAASEGQVRAA